MINMSLASWGIFLSLVLVVSISVFSIEHDAFAQEDTVSANSIGFEETTIIEFESNDNAQIDTFRIWLGSDFTFKSFKTEKGWTGQKTPQGVIIFTTNNPLERGQIVKFGVTTDKPKPGINWKALVNNDEEVAIGKTLVSEIANVIEPAKNGVGSQTTGNGPAILDSSTFRLIPEKPNIGSTIRVTGDNFGINQKLDFHIKLL